MTTITAHFASKTIVVKEFSNTFEDLNTFIWTLAANKDCNDAIESIAVEFSEIEDHYSVMSENNRFFLVVFGIRKNLYNNYVEMNVCPIELSDIIFDMIDICDNIMANLCFDCIIRDIYE